MQPENDNLNRYSEVVNDNLDRPFAVSGRRTYLCGHMDGGFPDMGHHLPGEMGGLWTPPIKLADGWWFGLSQVDQEDWQWMHGDKCQKFRMETGQADRQFMLEVGQQQIEAEQTLVVPYDLPALFINLRLTNHSDQPVQLKLAWLVRFELRGAWWSDWPDRPDEAFYDPATGSILARDSLTTRWAAIMRSLEMPTDFKIGPDLWAAEQTGSFVGTDPHLAGIIRNPDQLRGAGISGQLVYEVELMAGVSHTLRFVITGGPNFQEAPLRKQAEQLLEGYWGNSGKRAAQLNALMIEAPTLETPVPGWDHIFDGSVMCLDLLTADFPSVGRGIMAGLPGFAWFFGCDTYYSLSGLLVSGQAQTGLDTLRVLAGYARRQKGRVPHEIVQNGDMFNPGNPVESAEFVTSVERAFRWTGNRAFLNEMYGVCKAALFDYLLGECDPKGDFLPNGPGLLELSSAEHGKKLDVASCLYQALGSMTYLAGAKRDEATARRCRILAEQVRQRIERYFWLPERGEYVWRIEDDLTALPDEPAHSYAVLEMGVEQDKTRAISLFEKVEGPEHTGPRGLIHPGTTDFVMPIQNAIMALAEFRYGRPDQGLRYLQFCADEYAHYMPWAIPEFIGKDACFVQAWSSATFNWLVVQGFFRLRPDPLTNTIRVQPQLPTNWPRLVVTNLVLWGEFYDLRLERQGGAVRFSYLAHDPSSKLTFEVVNEPNLPTNFV